MGSFSLLRSNLRNIKRSSSEKATQFQPLTKSVLNRRSPEDWRKTCAESEFWVATPRTEVLGFAYECPQLLGFSCAHAEQRECLSHTDWRSERDWAPTFSEFVARILLLGGRPGSNPRPEYIRKTVSVGLRYSPALTSATAPTIRSSPPSRHRAREPASPLWGPAADMLDYALT